MAPSSIDKTRAHFEYRMVNEAACKKRRVEALLDVQRLDIGKNARCAVGHERKHLWTIVDRGDARAPLKKAPSETAGGTAELQDLGARVKQRAMAF